MKLSLAALSCALAAACAPAVDTDPLSHLPRFEEQRQALCARERPNAVTDVFCTEEAPAITSISELREALGISLDVARPGLSLTANSTSLSTRSVSSINPRAVFVQSPDERDDGSFMSLAFTRGDQLAEIGVKPPDGDLALYLLRYEQPCNDDDAGCSFADRLSPRTESGWTRYSIYDDVDLESSVFDCLVCHQPEGPGTPVTFRMQEFQNPWTHWMAVFGDGEHELLLDFGRAHDPAEGFAGIPRDKLVLSNPIIVENFFKDSGGVELNAFPSQVIEDEVTASSPGQPADNSIPGQSATWDALYERAVRGEVGPPPYHDVKITDPAKLDAMATAYRSFMAGDTDELPDIRDVIRDEALADMSIRPKAGLDGREMLVHMCAQCHNDTLDQSVSRARFNPLHLDEMPRDVRDSAIARLRLPREDRNKMPPPLLRELSDEEVAACVDALNASGGCSSTGPSSSLALVALLAMLARRRTPLP